MSEASAEATPGRSPLGPLSLLASRGAIYTAGIVLSRFLSFLLVPLYTRLLTPEDYGVLELVDTADNVVVVIFSAAITDSFLRFFNDARSEAERARTTATAALSLVVVGCLIGVGGWALAPSLAGPVLRDPSRALLLRWTFAAVGFQSLIEIPLAVYRGEDRPYTYVAAVVGRYAFGLVLNVVFLVVFHLGVRGIVLSSLCSSALVATLTVGALLRRTGLHFDRALLRRVLRFGWPLIPGAVAMLGLQHSRSYVLAHYTTLSEVGLWSLGARFGMMVSLALGQPLRSAWSAQMYKVWDGEPERRSYRRIGTLFVGVFMFAALGLSAFSPLAIRVMADASYQRAALVVPAVAFAFAMREIADYFRNGLFVARATGAIAGVEPAAAVVDLCLGIVLVERFGLYGAIVTTPVVFFLYLLAMHGAVRRALPVRYEYGRMIALSALALAGALLAVLAPGHSLAGGLLRAGAIVLAYPVLAALLIFREPDERAFLARLRRRVWRW
ncbi:MAG: lipopolysaccharide biosynthesis protein [Deltaproteobacteria bacterium]|nr:lipopolysaccharide biosynthesis protein [Deltaproteobacteria bacterium]